MSARESSAAGREGSDAGHAGTDAGHEWTGHQGRELRFELRTSAPAETVWSAWADPARISEWFVDRAEGEAVPGGRMRWIFETFGVDFTYEVVAAKPPGLLVLRGDVPGRGVEVLEVTIAVEGGETVLRLVNSGFLGGGEWDEEYEGVRSGWRKALAILKYYLERHYGRAKQELLVMRPAEYSFEEILGWYTDPDRLARWLTVSGAPGVEGERYRMELRDGSVLDGETLAVTDRELALSWDAENLVLELAAYSGGPDQRMVAVRGTAWGMDAGRLARIEAGMAAALDRLAAALQAAATGS